ncbi:hypothetical protein [Candidatus Pelagibacter communis]|uniref:hypothetical protein n=1 Tax=Pelagibacter ubique TaxID=198252 RepID=UPI00094C2E13|nr:hypothetical protein [Candidatus Pelagibacter ubique]
MSKLKVIYIASNGRSGSTLLQMLLNLHKNIFTVGELQELPNELKKNGICGCKRKISLCKFWQKVLKSGRINLSEVNYFRKKSGSGKVLRFFFLYKIFFKKKINTNFYINQNLILFRKIYSNISPSKKMIVDSSKDPYRLYYFLCSNKFEVYPIHIKKKPQAFVYSMSKKNQNNLYKIIRLSIKYLIENYIIRSVCKIYSKKFIEISYEELAKTPTKVVNNILKNLELKKINSHEIKNFRSKFNHAISGNEMKFRNDKIKYDNKWEKNMPFLNKLIVSIFNFNT